MAIEIRRATPDDAGMIAEFALLLFAQHRGYDPERFADLGNVDGAAAYYGGRTTDSGAAVFIATNDGNPVGYAYMQYEAVNYTDLMVNAALLHDIAAAAEMMRRRPGTNTWLMRWSSSGLSLPPRAARAGSCAVIQGDLLDLASLPRIVDVAVREVQPLLFEPEPA